MNKKEFTDDDVLDCYDDLKRMFRMNGTTHSYSVLYLFDHYLNQEPFEIVYTALQYPDEFDVYFTEVGPYKKKDFIISDKNRKFEKIYQEVYSYCYKLDKISYEEFINSTYIVDNHGNISSQTIAESGQRNGLFLDESTKSNTSPKNISSKKCLYTYKGPVYRFNNLYSRYWEGQTYATSEKQAKFLLNNKAKKEYGFVPNTNLSVDPRYIQVVQTQDSETFSNTLKPRKRCKVCGTPLNDGGTCPVCDDGEEDY